GAPPAEAHRRPPGAPLPLPPPPPAAPRRRGAFLKIPANSAGVAELTAQGPNDSFEPSRLFLQVRSNTSGLRVERLESSTLVDGLILPATVLNFPLNGGPGVSLGEPLTFRVRDDNFLPYAGVRLTTTASGHGSTRGTPLTDRP